MRALLPGCFEDNRGEPVRQLSFRACWIHGPNAPACAALSLERCGGLCRAAGFPVAGVEASHECTCGTALARPQQTAPPSACGEQCTGNASERCGGQFRLWAYAADSVPPAPPLPPPLPPPPPPRPPAPPDPRFRPIFHAPANNPPGYVGDANGLMFRRVPWNAPNATRGLYHAFWQAEVSHGLWWGHAVSLDYVRWHTLPWNTSVGPGAASGGAAQLATGDVLTVFTGRGNALGSGAQTARPVNVSDPLLARWRLTNRVAGPLGSDMTAPFRGADCRYRMVATCGLYITSVPHGELCLFVSNDTGLSWAPQAAPGQPAPGVLHRYRWRRCVDLPSQCGGHTNPCDPGMFEIPGTGVTVLYTMQKTCQCSGREFYALGTVDPTTHAFSLLDPRSDIGNNLWDGGEGYAHMSLTDPSGRVLWTGAVIEGDRDPASCAGSGFPTAWTAEKGWFGTLTLPRVVELGNLTTDDGRPDVFLVTPPLPELAVLRGPACNASQPLAPGDVVAVPGLLGRSVEVDAHFSLPAPGADGSGWDVGVQVLWDGGDEYTRVGVRDGTVLPGVDLWDEVNGDASTTPSLSAEQCRAGCAASSACGAWTHTAVPGRAGTCRTKAAAARALQVVDGSPGCFLPNYGGWGANASSTSGFVQQRRVRFAQLYIDRGRSQLPRPGCAPGNSSAPCVAFGKFGYAQTLRIAPTDTELRVHVFADRSIVEAFGQGGRAAVTARVYPTSTAPATVGLFSRGPAPTAARAAGWPLASANVSKEHILRGLGLAA